MSGLVALPTELLDEVLTYVQGPDLAALNVTCSSLRQKTAHVLYQQVRLHWKDRVTDPPPIGLLLRSLMRKPQLTGQIQSLSIEGQKPYESWNPEEHPNLAQPEGKFRSAWVLSSHWSTYFSVSERQEVTDLIASVPSLENKTWNDWFDKGEIDILLALLILKCNKLERLTIDKDYFQSGFVDKALCAVCTEGTHQGLKVMNFSLDLQLASDAWFAICPFNATEHLLAMPNIHYICASLPSRTIRWGRKIPSSSLKILKLHHTRLFDADLGELLKATPQLSILEYCTLYAYDAPPIGRRYWEYLDCAVLMESLLYVCHCLESLVISVFWYSFDGDYLYHGTRPISGSLQRLCKFSKLSSVVVPYVLLLGWSPPSDGRPKLCNLLPSSLKRLTLTDDSLDFDYSDWTAELINTEIRDFLPKFKASVNGSRPFLTIQLGHGPEFWTSQQQQDLITCCQLHCVNCSFDTADAYSKKPVQRLRQHRIRGRLWGIRGRGRGCSTRIWQGDSD